MSERRAPHVVVAPTQRSRGRPRLPQALTPAERAKRYRDKKKRERTGASGSEPAGASATRNVAIKRDAMESVAPTVGRLEAHLILVNSENIRLTEDLEAARDQLQKLRRALEESLHAHANKKILTAERVRAMAELLKPLKTSLHGVKAVTPHKK